MDVNTNGFQILPSNELRHQKKQFGMGVLDLNSLSALLIAPDNEVSVDMGLLHAKSAVERGIRFTPEPGEVPEGLPYWIVWVAMDRGEHGPYIAGMSASFMTIDRPNRKGYKRLHEHVNAMDKALKRRFHLYDMPEDKKQALKEYLQQVNPQAFENSPPEFHQLWQS